MSKRKLTFYTPTQRWVLRDCNGEVIGRAWGYDSIKCAIAAQAKLQAKIWLHYDLRKDKISTRLSSVEEEWLVSGDKAFGAGNMYSYSRKTFQGYESITASNSASNF